jgi:hypothetical protein
VKHQQSLIDMEVEKMKGYAEMEKAGFDYKAQIADSAAKIEAAHASAATKHLEVLKHIHTLYHAQTQSQMQPQNNQSTQ